MADDLWLKRELNPMTFWGVVTLALTIVLALILRAIDASFEIFFLLLVPVAAYLLIIGAFLAYLTRLARARDRLWKKEVEREQARGEELTRLNKELGEYSKRLFDKDFELTLANRRLQELEQAKSKFVSVTTHQLRTPLSAIKWTFHMLAQGSLGPITDEQRNFIQKGYNSAQRMIIIVNNLLNIDYIEADRDDYNFVSVKLEDLIEDLIFEFTNQCQSKQTKLIFHRPAEALPPVSADPVKLGMVFENLIDNAIKYTPSGGQIEISLRSDRVNTARGVVEVIVSDSGIGIPPDDRHKIFHRFFRARNAVKVETDGSGLGLFISRDIVRKHQGEIWFESQEGRGSIFHFTVPVRQSAG